MPQISLSISQYLTRYGSGWPFCARILPHALSRGPLQYATKSTASWSIGARSGARRHLPFRLARQMLAGETGEGVGLVIADMGNGGRWIDRLQAGERHHEPGAIVLPPVAGRLPGLSVQVLRLYRRPAIRQPERGRRIAPSLDEREPLGIAGE